MSPLAAPRWSDAQLDAGRAEARELFRKARVEEPAELYTDQFEIAYQSIAEVLEMSVDLADLRSVMKDIVHKEPLRRSLRYITGPPISDDDLKTVADVQLTRQFYKANPAAYDTVADAIFLLLDRKRFGWVADGRTPTAEEKEFAMASTAAIAAYQKVQAIRRNSARSLEASVATALEAAGFTRVPKRTVNAAGDWPAPGEFCGEGKVANRQADLIVTLFDTRYMPIECKVSGSSLNSLKRLNNDAVAKFATWTTYFGNGQTVPVAVLEGVYQLDRLGAAQNAGATIFWSHKLDELVDFAKAAV